eukprot:1340961-Amphidinium_carterae.1
MSCAESSALDSSATTKCLENLAQEEGFKATCLPRVSVRAGLDAGLVTDNTAGQDRLCDLRGGQGTCSSVCTAAAAALA